jgi:hypothetical protein
MRCSYIPIPLLTTKHLEKSNFDLAYQPIPVVDLLMPARISQRYGRHGDTVIMAVSQSLAGKEE